MLTTFGALICISMSFSERTIESGTAGLARVGRGNSNRLLRVVTGLLAKKSRVRIERRS